MSRKRMLSFAAVGIFVLLQIYLVFIKDFSLMDYWKYRNDFPMSLTAKGNKLKAVTQSFYTPGALVRLDIMLANYKIKPKSGTLQLSIFKGEERLFMDFYPANTVEDNQFYSFAVDPSAVPAGNYTLQLKYLPGEKKDRLAVWIFRKDIYPHGNFAVRGRPKNSDMTFRAYYLSTLWGAGERIFSTVPGIWWGRFWLAVGFVAVLLLLNGLFIYFVFRAQHSGIPAPKKTKDHDL
ncbi:MAG: hypothetical protein GY765_08915 [bacterium]|nr:hypothetical protein [bacterium]